MIKNVPYGMIGPNPWQPRQSIDSAGLEELALSIARDGLLQTPVGRENPTPDAIPSYQLALGHRRLAAWILCNGIEIAIGNGAQAEELQVTPLTEYVRSAMAAGRTFEEIPLDVQLLTDQQMFEMALQENLQRKDLNPIEQAEAEARYMREFKVTSEKAAEFFGKSSSTIRGDVRLLELPDTAKEKISSGEITVGVARKLLTVQRIAPAKVEAAIEQIARTPDPEDAIGSVLHDSEGILKLWDGWRNDTPRAGEGLWLLTTPAERFSQLPRLKAHEVTKVLGIEFTAQNRPDIERWISEIETDAKAADRLVEFFADKPSDLRVIERIIQLVDPPACNACPFLVKHRNDYYCGVKLCHNRKRKSWEETELERISKETGISIYDPGQDGKDHLDLQTWDDKHKKLYEDKDGDLRLIARPTTYGHAYTNDILAKVILVGKRVKAAKKAAATPNQEQAEREARWKRERELSNASDQFIERAAAPAFASLLEGIQSLGLLMAMAGFDEDDLRDPDHVKQPSKVEKMQSCRQQIMQELLGNRVWGDKDKGPVAVAQTCEGLARTWGLQLRASWLEEAKIFMPESVSTETEAA